MSKPKKNIFSRTKQRLFKETKEVVKNIIYLSAICGLVITLGTYFVKTALPTNCMPPVGESSQQTVTQNRYSRGLPLPFYKEALPENCVPPTTEDFKNAGPAFNVWWYLADIVFWSLFTYGILYLYKNQEKVKAKLTRRSAKKGKKK